ncbi:hypothetical protein [Rufibacter quisquiliarum]|uniref:Uncharacterized protein n=1 Tax=Rufibacter quisquiliarum TaxID=1549639 RepID=A0A839GZ40_9BACT|nr:hypothetical protein [Rufibacter quisquiliarum]MBA9078931.1 hypothetical protein [Rufibacter quisquiliarum]
MANYSEYTGFEATGFTVGGFTIQDARGVVYWENPANKVELASGNYIASATDMVAGIVLQKQAINSRPELVYKNGVPLIKTRNGGHYLRSAANNLAPSFKFNFLGTGVDFDFWMCLKDFTGTALATNSLVNIMILSSSGNTGFYVNHNNASGVNRMSCGIPGVLFMETANNGFPSGDTIIKVKARRVGSTNYFYLYRRRVAADANGVRTLLAYELIAQGTSSTAPKSALTYTSEQVVLGSNALSCSFYDIVFRRRDLGQTQAQLDKDEEDIDADLAFRFLGM